MKIFLNHAVEDKSLVMPYYEKLQALGYEPWIDKRLLPGDEWDEEIQRAFNSADVYLIFLSPRSVAKRGQTKFHRLKTDIQSLASRRVRSYPACNECSLRNHRG